MADDAIPPGRDPLKETGESAVALFRSLIKNWKEIAAAGAILSLVAGLGGWFGIKQAITSDIARRELAKDYATRSELETRLADLKNAIAQNATTQAESIAAVQRSSSEQNKSVEASLETTRRTSVEDLIESLRSIGKYRDVEAKGRILVYKIIDSDHQNTYEALLAQYKARVKEISFKQGDGKKVRGQELDKNEEQLLVIGPGVRQGSVCELVRLLDSVKPRLHVNHIAVGDVRGYQGGAFDVGVGYPKDGWGNRCASIDILKGCPVDSDSTFASWYDTLSPVPPDACLTATPPTSSRAGAS